MSKRVAVIGAGPAGLATIKELLDEGQQPIGFERASSLGGVFRFAERDGVIWHTCRLTSSGVLMAFSDFPVLAEESEHMSADQYVAYLTRYADTFKVTEQIRFGTTVTSVVRRDGDDEDWIVQSRGPDGVISEESFDAVAVCSGVNQHTSVPEFPGRETFTGEVIHGSAYRSAEQARGRRVLVIGGGESGADIVAEVSQTASETLLSLRRGVAVVRRRRSGRPQDFRLCRLHHSASHWLALTRNPADNWKRRVYFALCFPFALADKAVQSSLTFMQELVPLWRHRLLGGPAGRAEARLEQDTRRLARQLLANSGGVILEQFGTKNDDFVRSMARGQLRLASTVERFDGPRVTFTDGHTFEPDLVILCTGFRITMPYLDAAFTTGPRYFHTFNPSVGPSLGFVGFVRPAHGAIPPLAELQARWFAQIQSGHTTLAGDAEMRSAIERMIVTRQHLFRAVKGRLDHLVDYTSFSDALASLSGCMPTREAVRQERFALRWRFFGGPFVTAQYRLVGPHAKPALAREVIEKLPASYPTPMLAVLYMRWALSRVLHRLLGPEFAPKLTL